MLNHWTVDACAAFEILQKRAILLIHVTHYQEAAHRRQSAEGSAWRAIVGMVYI